MAEQSVPRNVQLEVPQLEVPLKVQLIATDMDGTLTIEEKFSPQLFEALERLACLEIPVLVVTGRSAGWVSAIAHYFPIAGAICENGGLLCWDGELLPLVEIESFAAHRDRLLSFFQQLQVEFPSLQESTDNRFRLTDWTFDVTGLLASDLEKLAALCRSNHWGFTYSTVQCHIMLPTQNKANGVQRVLRDRFPEISLDRVITVGDSPNDESLFNPSLFPHSVGVANVVNYLDRLKHAPQRVMNLPAGAGFCELVDSLCLSEGLILE